MLRKSGVSVSKLIILEKDICRKKRKIKREEEIKCHHYPYVNPQTTECESVT